MIFYAIQEIGGNDNSPDSLNVMANYHYVVRIWKILVTPNFWITYTILKNIIQVNQLIYIYNH